MTDTFPDEWLEKAARAFWDAEHFLLTWQEVAPEVRDKHRKPILAALQAVYPLIREHHAKVAEFHQGVWLAAPCGGSMECEGYPIAGDYIATAIRNTKP